ncbi:MAG: penicillin-binding protein 1A [Longimicrobiaceae bacterium]
MGGTGKQRTVRLGQLALLAGSVLFLAAFSWVYYSPCWLGGCAPVQDLTQYQAEGSEVFDSDGDAFAVLATVNRRVIPLDSLPDHLPDAFLAIEDQRFYGHEGIDIKRMAAAMVENVKSGGVEEGGSTITMQLAQNLFPERFPFSQRSVLGKLMEVRVARQIERTFPKDKILELYLNHIYLGQGSYGVDAAARTYFGKSAAELGVAEAAVLAALPQAPSRLNPRDNPEGALERRNLVLRMMVIRGDLSRGEARALQAEPVELAPEETAAPQPAAYFLDRVRRELEEKIGTRYYTAGLKVHTSLDRVAQSAAEEELAAQLDAIEAGRYGGYRHPGYPSAEGAGKEGGTPYLQGVVIVMETETGAVRALVGGRDFEDSKFNRAFQAERQAGSAFKPFIYLTALRRHRAPTYKMEDAPVAIQLSRTRTWRPRNYQNQYDGSMTLREALTRSKNTVAVRLSQELGVGSVIRTAHELGITSDIPEVPSVALGAAAVRPIEMTTAFAAFGNGGYLVEPYFVTRVEDRDGRILWEQRPEREKVLDAATGFVLTRMLAEVVERGTARAVRGAGFGGPAAGKTGTTNDAADVWFVGYTPDLVGTVWIGLDEPERIVYGASGGTLAAPVWGRVMRRVYQERPLPDGWSRPSGVVTEQVDRATGFVVTPSCPAVGEVYTEYFVSVRPPRQTCYPEGYEGVFVMGDSAFWGDEEWDAVEGWGDGEFWSYEDEEGEERPGVYILDGEQGEPDVTRPGQPGEESPAGEEPSEDEARPGEQETEPEPDGPSGEPEEEEEEDGPDLLGEPPESDGLD